MNVEFRIMGVPQRKEYIQDMLEQLGLTEDIVTYDYSGQRKPYVTARRTWLKPTTADCVCVLQDDLLLCENFKEIVTLCAENFPDRMFSFVVFPLTEAEKNPDTPYLQIRGGYVTGQAIMMPTNMIKKCFDWCNEKYGEYYIHDDLAIGDFAYKNKIPVMSTIPGLVQHLAWGDSTLGYNGKNKINKVFEKSPDVEFFKTKEFAKTKKTF